MEKIINFSPAYDKRNPDLKKNYGIGSIRMWMVLKGKKGAVQCLFSLPIYLPETVKEYKTEGVNGRIVDLNIDYDGEPRQIECWDVGYHDLEPHYEGQHPTDCEYTSTGKCYYDGSSLRGKDDNLADIFLRQGEKPIWEYLEKYYKNIFGDE